MLLLNEQLMEEVSLLNLKMLNQVFVEEYLKYDLTRKSNLIKKF
jgi:hypothetical protein